MLEFMQLFVFSRISDVTDLFTAALGAALGGAVGGRLAKREARSSQPLPWAVWLPFALAAGWLAALLFLFWYPFNFRTDGVFLRERLQVFLTRVPFEAYYYGTEFRAVTEALHKVLFFIPLGALLAWFVSHLRWTWRGYATFLSLALIAATSAGTVAGRLALPDKNPDSMDIVLQWLGGSLGFVMIRFMLSRKMLAKRPGKGEISEN
jgi:glycopeptide antibiotics resistance protein